MLFLLFSTVGFHQLRFLQEYFKAVESPMEGKPRDQRSKGPEDQETTGPEDRGIPQLLKRAKTLH